MGFEDLFENSESRREKRFDSHHHSSYKRDYDDNHHGQGDSSSVLGNRHHDPGNLPYWFAKIRSNRKLRMWISIVGVILVVVTILLIILLFPLIIKMINYINQVGIKGVIDGITVFAEKLLNGSGK